MSTSDNRKLNAKTLAERFGYLDQDLKSPKHDDIMIWLDANVERIAKNWCIENLRQMIQEIKDKHGEALAGSLPDDYGFRIEKSQWEVPVTQSNSSYVVGFVDLQLSVYRQVPCVWRDRDTREYLAAPDRESKKLIFEVKTTIPSIGELVRQINLYRQFEPDAAFFVVAPECKCVDLLARQNIHFVQYREDAKTEAEF